MFFEEWNDVNGLDSDIPDAEARRFLVMKDDMAPWDWTRREVAQREPSFIAGRDTLWI